MRMMISSKEISLSNFLREMIIYSLDKEKTFLGDTYDRNKMMIFHGRQRPLVSNVCLALIISKRIRFELEYLK